MYEYKLIDTFLNDAGETMVHLVCESCGSEAIIHEDAPVDCDCTSLYDVVGYYEDGTPVVDWAMNKFMDQETGVYHLSGDELDEEVTQVYNLREVGLSNGKVGSYWERQEAEMHNMYKEFKKHLTGVYGFLSK